MIERKVIVIRRSSWPDRCIGLGLFAVGSLVAWWGGIKGLLRLALLVLGPVLGLVRGILRV
jgi:hypothetical protein